MKNDIERIIEITDQLNITKLRFSAQRGDVTAQSNLAALLVESGDYLTAAKWYRFAANQGDAKSQYNLGCLLLNGIGVKQDFNEAEKWFSIAAKQGYINAIYNLAFVREHGLGCQKDKIKAYELYMNAADCGDSDSQCKLAMILLEESDKNKIGSDLKGNEWPETANSTKARNLLELASKNGHKLASEILVKLGWID